MPRQPRIEVHDFWPRVLLSPVLGVGIASAVGLIDHRSQPALRLLGSALYFSALAFVIWEGNRRLYFRFRDPDAWFTHAWQRIAVLIGCVCLYTVPVSVAGILGWSSWVGNLPEGRSVRSAVLLIVICTVFIVHVYETVFLLRDWGTDRLRREQLQRATAEAELETLKREIHPHVLFNNLHALTHLIESSDRRAIDFVVSLAGIYRYLLETRRHSLVTLGEELTQLERHAALTDIRCAGGLRVHLDVPPAARAKLQIPPFSLPELLDNAIKHNALSPEQPLTFSVALDGPDLVVANDLRPASASATPSTGVGLENIRHRVALTTGGAVTWGVDEGRFVVRLRLSGDASESGAVQTKGPRP